MSLYQKYRPHSFADVVGQEHVVTTLEQASKQDKLSHAYLFSGSRGTGKTSVARIMARTLLTRGIDDEKMSAHIGKAVEDGTMVDVIEIDAASNRRIDDVRSLLEAIQFAPVVAKAKVYIIDEVHMLTKESFNALLKTLEEPPPYAYFILATTELHKIPATIQSRCQRFAFRAITEEDIVRRLQYIADQEHITVERPALRAIAHHVQGGLRDAVALLDQLRTTGPVTLKEVQERVGESGHEYVETLLQALRDGDAEKLMTVTTTMEEMAVPLENVLRLLLAHVRTEMRQAITMKLPLDAFTAMLDVLLQGVRDLRSSPVPGLVMETTLLRLMGIINQDGSAPVQSAPTPVAVTPPPKKIEPAPVSKPAAAAPSNPSPNPPALRSPPQADEVGSPHLTEAPVLSLETLRKAWPDIAQELKTPSVRMSLKNGRVVDVKDGMVILAFASAFHRDKVAAMEASRALEQNIEAVFKRALRVHCTLEQDRPVSTVKPSEDMVNLAEAAAEVF